MGDPGLGEPESVGRSDRAGIVRVVPPDVPCSVFEVRPGEFEVSGEVDAHSAPALASRLNANVPATERLVLDLSGVTFMDSSGLRVVVELHHQSIDGGPQLVIKRPSRPVTRLFDIAGMSELLTCID